MDRHLYFPMTVQFNEDYVKPHLLPIVEGSTSS